MNLEDPERSSEIEGSQKTFGVRSDMANQSRSRENKIIQQQISNQRPKQNNYVQFREEFRSKRKEILVQIEKLDKEIKQLELEKSDKKIPQQGFKNPKQRSFSAQNQAVEDKIVSSGNQKTRQLLGEGEGKSKEQDRCIYLYDNAKAIIKKKEQVQQKFKGQQLRKESVNCSFQPKFKSSKKIYHNSSPESKERVSSSQQNRISKLQQLKEQLNPKKNKKPALKPYSKFTLEKDSSFKQNKSYVSQVKPQKDRDAHYNILKLHQKRVQVQKDLNDASYSERVIKKSQMVQDDNGFNQPFPDNVNRNLNRCLNSKVNYQKYFLNENISSASIKNKPISDPNLKGEISQVIQIFQNINSIIKSKRRKSQKQITFNDFVFLRNKDGEGQKKPGFHNKIIDQNQASQDTEKKNRAIMNKRDVSSDQQSYQKQKFFKRHFLDHDKQSDKQFQRQRLLCSVNSSNDKQHF